jgi:hypothetical protein
MGAPLCIWTESGCSEDDASERDDQQGPDMSDHLTLSEVVLTAFVQRAGSTCQSRVSGKQNLKSSVLLPSPSIWVDRAKTFANRPEVLAP